MSGRLEYGQTKKEDGSSRDMAVIVSGKLHGQVKCLSSRLGM